MIFRIQSFRQAAVWSTLIHAGTQVLALLFGMLMAHIFGAQGSTDILYYGLGIFVFLSTIFQQVNVSVLIPETMRRREQTGERDAMAFINIFFSIFFVLMVAIISLMMLWPIQIMTRISKFDPVLLQEQITLIRGLLFLFPLQLIERLLLDVLVSYKFLTLPAMLAFGGRLINIGFVLCFHRQLGILSAIYGMACGWIIQIILNLYLLQHILKWNWGAWRTKISRTTYTNILWVEAGLVLGILARYIPMYLFSGLSVGMMTALNYAQRMFNVPMNVVTEQVSSITAVKFNELAAKGQHGLMNEALERIIRNLLFILIPLSMWLALIGRDVITILFGHGKFQGAALETTIQLFSLFSLSLPLLGIMTIQTRFIIAHQAFRYATFWRVISMLLNISMVWLAIRFWGAIGFPIGAFIYVLVYLCLLSLSMDKAFPGLSQKKIWQCYFTSSAMYGLMAVTITAMFWKWGGVLNPWLRGGIISGIFVVLCALFLKCCPADRDALRYYSEWVRRWSFRIGLIGTKAGMKE